MTFRIRTNTGCNHLSNVPCNRCWYDSVKSGRLQGAGDLIVAPHAVSFPSELIFEHAFDPWERPHPISSREELRRLCNERGVTSHYLRDSTVWRTGETRWV